MKLMRFALNEEHAKNSSKNSAYDKQKSNQKDLGKVEERKNGIRF